MILKVSIKYNKVSAFTVVDMIAGMVIMSIIMSLVFFIFSSFTKQVSDYSVSRSNLVALNLLKIELEQEVIRADKIIEKPQGFSILQGSSEIHFKYLDKAIIKTSKFIIDTVYSNVTKIQYNSESSQNFNVLDERITEISMQVFVNSKEMNLYFYKNYSNQEKINYAILDETK